jgi:hypothetical protein
MDFMNDIKKKIIPYVFKETSATVVPPSSALTDIFLYKLLSCRLLPKENLLFAFFMSCSFFLPAALQFHILHDVQFSKCYTSSYAKVE